MIHCFEMKPFMQAQAVQLAFSVKLFKGLWGGGVIAVRLLT